MSADFLNWLPNGQNKQNSTNIGFTQPNNLNSNNFNKNKSQNGELFDFSNFSFPNQPQAQNTSSNTQNNQLNSQNSLNDAFSIFGNPQNPSNSNVFQNKSQNTVSNDFSAFLEQPKAHDPSDEGFLAFNEPKKEEKINDAALEKKIKNINGLFGQSEVEKAKIEEEKLHQKLVYQSDNFSPLEEIKPRVDSDFDIFSSFAPKSTEEKVTNKQNPLDAFSFQEIQKKPSEAQLFQSFANLDTSSDEPGFNVFNSTPGSLQKQTETKRQSDRKSSDFGIFTSKEPQKTSLNTMRLPQRTQRSATGFGQKWDKKQDSTSSFDDFLMFTGTSNAQQNTSYNAFDPFGGKSNDQRMQQVKEKGGIKEFSLERFSKESYAAFQEVEAEQKSREKTPSFTKNKFSYFGPKQSFSATTTDESSGIDKGATSDDNSHSKPVKTYKKPNIKQQFPSLKVVDDPGFLQPKFDVRQFGALSQVSTMNKEMGEANKSQDISIFKINAADNTGFSTFGSFIEQRKQTIDMAVPKSGMLESTVPSDHSFDEKGTDESGQTVKYEDKWDASTNLDEDEIDINFQKFDEPSLQINIPSTFNPFANSSSFESSDSRDRSDRSDSSSQNYDPFGVTLPRISSETSSDFSDELQSDDSSSSTTRQMMSLEDVNMQFVESLMSLRASGVAEIALTNAEQLLQPIPGNRQEYESKSNTKFDPSVAKIKLPKQPRFSRTPLGVELRTKCQSLLNYNYVFNT